MNEEYKDLEDKSPEYRAGFSVGTAIAYVVASCGCALLIGVTIKILQWMLF